MEAHVRSIGEAGEILNSVKEIIPSIRRARTEIEDGRRLPLWLEEQASVLTSTSPGKAWVLERYRRPAFCLAYALDSRRSQRL
jgi:hypothetical protein